MQTIARAHAKFILSGEHFVVKGASSIVIPAECFSTQIILSDQGTREISVNCIFECESPIPPQTVRSFESQVSRLIAMAAPMIGVDLSGVGLRCTVKSSIPPGQGAGSSSALCQAIIESLLKHFISSDIHPNYLKWFGTALENAWHGPVSGVDNAAIAYGRPLCYQRGERPEPIAIGMPLFLVVGSTGNRDASHSPYEIMRSFAENNKLRYELFFNEINENVSRMRSAMSRGDIMVLAESMYSSHRIYQSIGLSSPLQNQAVDAARDAGALAARMTGAGGGGFVIALVSPADIERIQKIWMDMGLHDLRSIQFLG